MSGPAGSAPAADGPRVLVLGYGNPGRQDDGLGPAVAAGIERLGRANVTVQDNYQLAIEDSILVAGHDVVWFVDAATSGEGCTARRVSPALDFTFTSHLLKPEALLAIAGQQFGRHPEAWLLAVRGYEFGLGEGLTAQAQANLAAALNLLTARIPQPVEAPP